MGGTSGDIGDAVEFESRRMSTPVVHSFIRLRDRWSFDGALAIVLVLNMRLYQAYWLLITTLDGTLTIIRILSMLLCQVCW